MKYYLAIDAKSGRHILVANNLDEATTIASHSISINDIYELQADTFNKPGFLISDK